MFREHKLLARYLSAAAVALLATVVASPKAVAACSCMCVDSEPLYVCTGFVNSQTKTAECDAALDCPAVEPPPEPEPPASDPVAGGGDTVEPPHPGLECKRRKVYRADLGAYKTYKVCKLARKMDKLEDKWERRRDRWNEKHAAKGDDWADKHADKMSRWRERYERKRARYEAKMAQAEAKGYRHDHDDDEDD